MARSSPEQSGSILERIYRVALRAYPRSFREEYEEEMVRLFREQYRDAQLAGRLATARFLLGVSKDWVKSAVAERLVAGERTDAMKQLRLIERYTPSRAFIAGFLMVLAITVAVTVAAPRLYQSKARVEVTWSGPADQPVTRQLETDPYVAQTELNQIGRQEVLERVIQVLGLHRKWSDRFVGDRESLTVPATIELLRRRLSLRVAAGTRLIEISVTSEDPFESAVIANTIIEQYRYMRVERARDSMEKAIQTMQEQRAQLEVRVREAQQKLARLREKYPVNHTLLYSGSGLTGNVEAVRRYEAQRTDAQGELIKLDALLTELKDKDKLQLRAVLPVAYPDERLTQLLKERDRVDSQVAGSAPQFTENHPQVRRLHSVQKTVEAQIDQQIDGIIAGLGLKQSSLKRTLAVLEETVNDLQKQDREEQASYQTYSAIHRELETQQQMVTALTIKIAQEQIDAESVPRPAINVIDLASTPLRPSRPNVPLNLSLGVLAGILVGLLLALSMYVLRRARGAGATPLAA